MIENLDEIKSQLDIRQVLNFIGYSTSSPVDNGTEIRDYCPVHGGDNQASLSINTASKLAFCHSCGFSGDLVQLYCKSRNIEFNKGIKEMTDHFGIEVKFSGATKTNMPKSIRTPQQVLNESSPQGLHQYLKDKKVDACAGLYFGDDDYGNESIVVPFKNIDGVLTTVQFVHNDGKFFLKKHKVDGFFASQQFKDGDTVYLAEGIATALTIWMALDNAVPVISFGSASNLTKVANALKGKYPNLKIVICLDNNAAAFTQVKNLGATFSCSYRLPSFKGLFSADDSKELADFNDLVSKCNQPIGVVKEQLKIVLGFNDLPIHHDEIKVPVNSIPLTNEMPSSLQDEYQEEVLSYLLWQPFDNVIKDGLNPENFDSSVFTGSYSLIMDGIVKTWEQELPITVAQVAINTGNSTQEFYAILKRIEIRPSIAAKQVAERLSILKKDNARRKFDLLLNAAQKSDQPLDLRIDALRKDVDDIQGQSATILPQAHYLHQILDELKNPKHKPLVTGIKSFDRLIGGGFIKTELGILAGGAGAGKTAFALQLADSVAKNGSIVIYVSVEIGRNKLTERSLKRLRAPQGKEKNPQCYEYGIAEYAKFSNNIYIVKGRHGMRMSEIRGMVLSIMRQHKDKDLLLIVDPFQRLGSGNEKADMNNETTKVGLLCSQLKDMAEDLKIPILALSDTVKSHNSDKSGESSMRGSYMVNHTGDYVMMLRASKDPLKAMYGENGANITEDDDPFIETIKKNLSTGYQFKPEGKHALKNAYDKYASLVTSKVRDNGKFSPLFVYKPEYHLFIDTELFENILPTETDK